MISDAYGGQHSSASDAAVEAFGHAVEAVASHAPISAALDATLRLDANFVAAHALRGIGNVILARAETIAASRAGVAATLQALAAVGGGSPGEMALAEAHALSAEGGLRKAAARLEAHLQTAPADFLAIKVAHALRFMAGDAAGMLSTTAHALRHSKAGSPGHGYLLGCHAFALEETGDLAAAEAVGRAAVEHQPRDVWALHAVAHVMEMSGRTREGIAWLEATTRTWPHCGAFGLHMAWHLALFHLAAGEDSRALELYDRHVRPTPACDFRDMANAASFLWRLEQDGREVGDRWHEIEDIAVSRRHDTSYVFASLHYLLALVGAGRLGAAHELLASLRDAACEGTREQALVARDVGVALAELIVQLGSTPRSRPDLAALARRLPGIGGSHAQRDVFLRTLIRIAADGGDTDGLAALSALRLAQRREDRFLRTVRVRKARRPMTTRISLDAGQMAS